MSSSARLLRFVTTTLFLAACGCDGSPIDYGSTQSTSSGGGTATQTGSGGTGGAGGTSTGGTGGSTQTGGGGTGGSEPKSHVHKVGRFDESDPARPRSTWPGTTLRTRLSGSSLSVSLGG